MSRGPVHVELAGARATLSSTFAEFGAYAAIHLAPLRIGGAGQPVVRATLRWHEGSPPNRADAHPELAAWTRLDRDLYRRDGELAWFRADELPGLQLRFSWDGAQLGVTGDYFYRLSADRTRDRVKRLLYRRRLAALRRRRFTTLLYYLLYYPCFWWLERHRGLHPIHAAGVELAEGVVVLAGPSGVGKSTLAAGVAGSGEARFLSDTFLLHDAGSVYPVREPLLLDQASQRWLGDEMKMLEPIAWRYCLTRDGFHWAAERLSPGGAARVLLFPHRAAGDCVRPVSAARAHGWISAGNQIVNDLRRYWAYAAVLEMLDPSPLMAARERQLASLVAGVRCYEFGLSGGATCPEVAATIRQLLRSGPPRAARAGAATSR